MTPVYIFYSVAITTICGIIAWYLYPVLFPRKEADRIHRIQQEALKRHSKAMQKDRERIAEYWAERGKVIRVHKSAWDGEIRYSASLDENKPLT